MSEALIVVDVQRAFDEPAWGPRNNPECEANVARLIEDFRTRGETLAFVRHDSLEAGSPLAREHPGNQFMDVVSGEPDVLVTKHVNSSFLGEPNLDGWLSERGIDRIAVCGIQTNMSCETTGGRARFGNLGYEVDPVIDATATFDHVGPDGETYAADLLSRVTAANLDGESRDRGDDGRLLEAVGDAATVQVVRRDLDADLVPGEDADAKAAHLAGQMGQQLVTVVQLDAEHEIGEGLGHFTLELDLLFDCHMTSVAPGQRCLAGSGVA